MLKRIFIIAALFTAIGFSANAQGYTATTIKDACLSDAPTETDAMMCFSTILATKDSLNWGALVVVFRLSDGEQPMADTIAQASNLLGICIGDDITNSVVISKVIDYLIDTEDLDGVPATRAIFSGLARAFPCQS